MAITITTRALRTELTTVNAVKALLFADTATSSGVLDTVLADMVRRASAACQAFCSRPFAREILSETVPGFDHALMQLGRTPLVNVASVAYVGDPITDYLLDDRDQGTLLRDRGWWPWTAAEVWNITPSRPPGSEQPFYTVVYTAGYLLPGDDVLSTGAIVVTSSDSSFNLASSGFPLLSSGDIVDTTGFGRAANNGRFTVASRTASKIVVSEALLSEGTTSASATSTAQQMIVKTLPADIEQAAIEAVKAWHFTKARDPRLQSRQIGDLSQGWGAGGWGMTPPSALSFEAQSLLGPWVRSV